MLPIFICEDHPVQRTKIETTIQNCILFEELPMKICLSTGDPYEIFDYVQSHPAIVGIFFLDIELSCDFDGIQLGAKIRHEYPDSKIVFITSHSEMMELTFRHKIEALDYIVKEDPDALHLRIRDALRQFQKQRLQKKADSELIEIKIGTRFRAFPTEEIMFFATSTLPHKIELHLRNGVLDFYGKISELEKLSPALKRVHHSFLVNQNNVSEIDQKTRRIEMKNGEQCYASARMIKNLQSL